MKAASSSLWQMIKSLSGAEKTFFKRNFTGNNKTEKIYLKLFDAIAAQKEYDETAILKNFAPSINKKNIAFQKHYLYNQVCDALIHYYSKNNVYQEIYKQIQLIRVFRKKGLLDEAHSLWKKTMLRARETESFALSSLLKQEFEKMILISGSHISYDELHVLLLKNVISYTEYTEMISLRDIYAEIILIKRNAHFDLNETDRARINELRKKVESYHINDNATSFWATYYYSMCMATLLYLSNENEKALELLKKLHAYWKQKPEFIQFNGEQFLELLYMINYSGILQGEYSYVKNIFEDECNNLITDKIQQANFEALRFVALNRIYNKTAKYDEVLKLVMAHKNKLKDWEPFLNADINRTVNLSVAVASFVLEQYDTALSYAKRAIAYYKKGVREEHHVVAQLLLFLTAFHSDNIRLFEAEYRSAYSYFQNKKKKHPFEKILILSLHKAFYAKELKAKLNEYQKAVELIEKNAADIDQKNIFSIFNFHGWLQSRIMRIPYRQYVEQKVRTQNMQPVL